MLNDRSTRPRRHGPIALVFASAMVMAIVVPSLGANKQVIAPPGPKPVGPYSPGILVGDFLYVSGQGGRDASGTLPATIDGEVRQTLRNVKSIVEAAGLTMEHVVYSQVYLTSMAHVEALERGWREAFPKSPPARAVVGVYKLPTDISVEINAVAFRDLARKRLIVPAAYPKNLSFSPGVMAGNRLYLSGSLGAHLSSGAVPPDPDAQVQLALDNMKATLAEAGMDFRHVVFVNPYLTGQASRQMNEIYAKHFEFGNTPARATIRVTSLPGGNTIEFTGVAIADLSKRRAVRPRNMRPSATASPCVFADDTYYCSAKGPFTPGPGNLQGTWVSTVEAQVRQTMRNLLDGLEEADMELSDVVATNVYLDDMADFARMNGVYAKYFLEAPPTRTTVAQLAPIDRTARDGDSFPGLEQISLIAVKRTPGADPAAVLESTYSEREIGLDTDPSSGAWAGAPRVLAIRDRAGQPIAGRPTEIRSRWTKEHLYLLYVCPYDALNLKPDPTPDVETPRLWNWDVGEAFIGSDFTRIGRYKEFQVSPQSEWVDLDIDRDDPKGQQGMQWNSGYTVRGRIDAQSKIWYGVMRIPFSAIDTRPPETGRELRIGLYRIGGVDPRKEYYTWRPTDGVTFHFPKAFGILRLR